MMKFHMRGTAFPKFCLALLCVGLWALPQEAWADEDLIPPQIVHEPCPEYQVGEPFGIWARFYDSSPIFDPKVVYRMMGAEEWANAPFVKQMGSEDFLAEIPVTSLRGGMEYFIEVFDEYGNGPARYGTPAAPVRVFPSASARLCRQIPQEGVSMGTTQGSSGAAAPQNPYAAPAPAPASPYSAPQPTPANPYAQPAPTQPAPVPQYSPPAATTPPPAQVPAAIPLTPTTPPGVAESGPIDPCEQDIRPLYCEAWLWVGISTVAVLGAGFGLYQALSGSPTPSEDIERYVTLDIRTTIPNPGTLSYAGDDGN